MANKPTAQWLLWKAKVDQCDLMVERLRASPSAVDPKWLRNTTAYYDNLKAGLLRNEPPKYPPKIGKLTAGGSPPAPFPVHRPIMTVKPVKIRWKKNRSKPNERVT